MAKRNEIDKWVVRRGCMRDLDWTPGFWNLKIFLLSFEFVKENFKRRLPPWKRLLTSTCKNPLLSPWNKSFLRPSSSVCRSGVLKRFCTCCTIHQIYNFATSFNYSGVIVQLYTCDNCFHLSVYQVILEPELKAKTLDAWSWRFKFRSGTTALLSPIAAYITKECIC